MTKNFAGNRKNIVFPKGSDPTNLRWCRSIEDFLGRLSSLVYNKGWEAKSIKIEDENQKMFKRSRHNWRTTSLFDDQNKTTCCGR